TRAPRARGRGRCVPRRPGVERPWGSSPGPGGRSRTFLWTCRCRRPRGGGEVGRVELVADLRSLLGGALRLEAALSLALLGMDHPDVRAPLRAAAADD